MFRLDSLSLTLPLPVDLAFGGITVIQVYRSAAACVGTRFEGAVPFLENISDFSCPFLRNLFCV